jgi:hypothetical protein
VITEQSEWLQASEVLLEGYKSNSEYLKQKKRKKRQVPFLEMYQLEAPHDYYNLYAKQMHLICQLVNYCPDAKSTLKKH